MAYVKKSKDIDKAIETVKKVRESAPKEDGAKKTAVANALKAIQKSFGER